MGRRRPTLRTYLRRRWRVLGLLVVLLASSLLVLAITDRGHDPLWQARVGYVDQMVVSPDGTIVYTLVRSGENEPITRLEAHAGENGDILWKTDMNATRALLAASDHGVAVATGFPRAFITRFDTEGRPQESFPLEGNPRALAMERDRVALALHAGGNPVLVYDDGQLVRTHEFHVIVNAIDMRAGRLAVGTSEGEVAIYERDGAVLHRAALDQNVLSLRFSSDGTTLAVGGYSLTPGDFSGAVDVFDLRQSEVLRWIVPTPVGVGLVDVDATGTRVLAIEESTPGATLHVYEAETGREVWRQVARGSVARDDAGAYGGASLSPDGEIVVVGTLRGDLRTFDGETGKLLWRFRSEGSTIVAFRDADPPLFVTNARLVPNGPLDTVLLFSPGKEPATASIATLALGIAGVTVIAAVISVSVGFWRVRRPY